MPILSMSIRNATPRPMTAMTAILVALITTDGAFARGGKTNNGAPSITATWSATARDHRGERSTPQVRLPPCHLYLGHWTGPGGCKGTVVRDHRRH